MSNSPTVIDPTILLSSNANDGEIDWLITTCQYPVAAWYPCQQSQQVIIKSMFDNTVWPVSKTPLNLYLACDAVPPPDGV